MRMFKNKKKLYGYLVFALKLIWGGSPHPSLSLNESMLGTRVVGDYRSILMLRWKNFMDSLNVCYTQNPQYTVRTVLQVL